MAVVTVDGPNKLLIEISTGGDNASSFADIYSDWKRWATTTDNLKYLQAIRYTGADPISATKNSGTTFFLMNGWKLRPAELNHQWQIDGNVFVDGGVGVPDVPTLGMFRVSMRYFVSNLVDSAGTKADSDRIEQTWLMVTDIFDMEVLTVGESKTMVRPGGNGAGLAGSITRGVKVYSVEQQGDGDTVILTRIS